MQGVPPELRPRVWPQVSGAAARQAAHIAGYYEAMVQRGASEAEFARQIELVRPRSQLRHAQPRHFSWAFRA